MLLITQTRQNDFWENNLAEEGKYIVVTQLPFCDGGEGVKERNLNKGLVAC